MKQVTTVKCANKARQITTHTKLQQFANVVFRDFSKERALMTRGIGNITLQRY